MDVQRLLDLYSISIKNSKKVELDIAIRSLSYSLFLLYIDVPGRHKLRRFTTIYMQYMLRIRPYSSSCLAFSEQLVLLRALNWEIRSQSMRYARISPFLILRNTIVEDQYAPRTRKRPYTAHITGGSERKGLFRFLYKPVSYNSIGLSFLPLVSPFNSLPS